MPFTCPSLFVDSSALMDIVVILYSSMTYDFALVFVDPYKVKTETFCLEEKDFLMKRKAKLINGMKGRKKQINKIRKEIHIFSVLFEAISLIWSRK